MFWSARELPILAGILEGIFGFYIEFLCFWGLVWHLKMALFMGFYHFNFPRDLWYGHKQIMPNVH